METQDPGTDRTLQSRDQGSSTDPSTGEFAPGARVIYGMHGKCTVLAVETRQLGTDANAIRFYKLEVQRSNLSRSQRQEPAIWVPIHTAKQRGLRLPMTREQADLAMKTLSSREYYFPVNEAWTSILPKLEECIRNEGGNGLAKVASYLFVLKRKQIVASSEVIRLQESIHKLLFRELAEATGEQPKSIEEKVLKGFKQKMMPDQ